MAWMCHEDFCWECMARFVGAGWAVRPGEGPTHLLTAEGAAALPRHAVVEDCPTCGTPIYRRWIEDGTAAADPAACPWCLDVADLVRT